MNLSARTGRWSDDDYDYSKDETQRPRGREGGREGLEINID